MDLKLRGLTWDLVEGAIKAAHDARLKIIDFMESVIPAPREQLSPYAPRMEVIKIPADKIGALIGKGGETIRGICERTGAQIDIEEEGAVTAEAEPGKIYEGTVTGIKEFGAFVQILPGIDGLCHISELSDKRVPNVEAVCKVGDKMLVKCLSVDDRGRIKLSRREAMKEADAAAQQQA